MKLTTLALTLSMLPSAAAIQTNGTIAVHLRAADFTTGQATWANVSTPAFGFTAVGTPRRESIDGAPCVVCDGGADHFQSPGNAPPFLCNNNPVSIETWVWNGNIQTAEPMVSWGTTTGLRTGISFNFAKCCKVAAVYDGAVSHNGFDQPWGAGGATPEQGRWHHLVYTWDGSTSRCYADGSLATTATSSLPLAVSTAGLIRICFKDAAGNASLALGTVRIHTGALTASQVENNFREELPVYAGGRTPANAAQACARLSVTLDVPPGPATTAALRRRGVIREDHDELAAAVLLPPATTPPTGTGTGVQFQGGSSITSPYLEIPRAAIAGRTAITIEFWATVLSARPGACLLSIGGTSASLPVTAPGGTFTPDTSAGRALVLRCGEPATLSGAARSRGFSTTGGAVERLSDTDDLGRMVHHVITWEPSSAEWRRYEDGLLVDSIPDPDGPMGLNTDNCWLGRSLNSADENAEVVFDELRLHNYALTQGEILLSELLGPELLVFPAAPATFAAWSAAHGTAVNPTGDHDGNGISNLVQFATDSDRDGMPNFGRKSKPAFFDVFPVDPDDYWELSIPAETTGVTYTLEESTTLTGFVPSSLMPDPRPMISEDGRSRVLRWHSTGPLPARAFHRVTVTQP